MAKIGIKFKKLPSKGNNLMSKKHSFTAVIINAGGGGAFVEVPFDVEKAFGSKKPRVKAAIEGVPYRGLLVRMGGEHHILIVLKGIREQIGKTFGEKVKVVVEADVEPRVIEIPKELLKLFKKEKSAKLFFDKLSYTHQKEYVQWINEAKQDETRQRRILKTIEMLNDGQKGR